MLLPPRLSLYTYTLSPEVGESGNNITKDTNLPEKENKTVSTEIKLKQNL